MSFEPDNPFSSDLFIQALVESKTLTPQTGWVTKKFELGESSTYGFYKNHSYGEYIFDWAWAEAYERHQVPYYPKLIHCTPFTPVNAAKILGPQKEELITAVKEDYLKTSLSGHHYLFTSPEETKLLHQAGYEIRDSLQFHWENKYESFEHFLSTLKSRKRKMIKKERRQIYEMGLEIKIQSLNEVSHEQMVEVYELYLTTIDKKLSHPYLNINTFLEFKRKLSPSGLLITANKGQKMVAMSLFFQSSTTLYGRYWGCMPEYQSTSLHFEMCYYMGMEICIARELALFEAGAQGEQKLLRGFAPVIIKSAHHLKIPQFHEAITRFIQEESIQIAEQAKNLESYLPFSIQLK